MLLLTSENDITLQANAFIASDERALCWSGDEHLVLEMNAFRAGDEHAENAHSNFSHTHTHTASYQRLPNKTYIEMIASRNYSVPRTDAIELRRSAEIQKVSTCCTTASCVTLTWSSRASK